MTCEIWTDHRYGADRVVTCGQDPQRGAYLRIRRTCVRCGKTVEETRWLNEGARRLYAYASWDPLRA